MDLVGFVVGIVVTVLSCYGLSFLWEYKEFIKAKKIIYNKRVNGNFKKEDR